MLVGIKLFKKGNPAPRGVSEHPRGVLPLPLYLGGEDHHADNERHDDFCTLEE